MALKIALLQLIAHKRFSKLQGSNMFITYCEHRGTCLPDV